MYLVADGPTSSSANRNVFITAWRKLWESRAQEYSFNVDSYGKRRKRRKRSLRYRLLGSIVDTFNIPYFKRHKPAKEKTLPYMDQFAEVNVRHYRRSVSEPRMKKNGVRFCTCCPSSRSGHRIFATDDFIYMLGGYDPNISLQTFTDAWRFNLVTERWDEVFPIADRLPKWLASFSLVPTSVSGEVLLFGGTGVPFGAAPSEKLLRINFRHDGTFDIASVATDGDAMPRLYGQAMAYRQVFNTASRSIHDAVYLVGGTTGTVYNMDVWRVESADVPSDNWKCSYHKCNDNEEEGRYRLEIVATDRHLIAFGGGSPGYCSGFEKLSAFDLQANQYIVLPTTADPVHGYPHSRKCHAIVEFEGGVYMIGGLNESIGVDEVYNTNILNDVWRFDLETSCWQKLRAELPIPVFFHAAAITKDGCIYVFGGCTTKNSSDRTNRLQRLWLRPPPLRHLAVRALFEQINPEETEDCKCEWDVGGKPADLSPEDSENFLANVSRMFWPYYTGSKTEYLLR